ncbi:TonB-dependent receptor [Flavobacterium agricola]|uniref:TonB-dependent receptor n=2 Tax=Flavobacterium agricola TaxID=2870839 RepID=A0ABY6M283_9FLAO|nr:TonB-dependent receptor [Flavobacterium agricola]
MDDLIITGQFNPQAVNKSIYDVQVITREMIDRQAGNNLADLLNQNLNIVIIPNASTGKSTGNMLGLDAQYFKILVDNIPLINEEGLGSNVDLTQINLDDIQRIEIVEGSMGVEYGSNAIAGVINIITKKGSTYKWSFTPMIQEETVGSEYNLKDKGRHIKSLKIEHNLTDRIYVNAIYTRNNFKGLWSDKKGENYGINDGLRGYEWLPKEQNTVKAMIRYKSDNYNLFYKFEGFFEQVDRYNNTVLENYNPITQTSNPTAKDAVFNSKRYVHHINAFGRFNDLFNYDVSFSLQDQKKSVEDYVYLIKQDAKTDVSKYDFQSRKGFYSRGSISNFLVKKSFDFQLGYELSSLKGFASPYSGDYKTPVSRNLDNYDFYASSEITLSDKLSVRPGARIMISPLFSNQLAWSFSAKYNLPKNYELRAIYGNSPRLPNFDELYSYFVDSNHDIQGNEKLSPEKGQSVFLSVKRQFEHQKLTLLPKLTLWYMDVSDRIDLAVVNQSPLRYSYVNVSSYQSFGSTLQSKIKYKNLSGGAGVTFSGVAQQIDDRPSDTHHFLYAIQANLNAAYTLHKTQTTLSLFLKYNGQTYQYVAKQENFGDVVYEKGKQNGYAWFDASIHQPFLNKNLHVTLGARNLFDVTSVRTSAIEGGTHNGPASNLTLGYGRSYFLKLLYNLNI